MSLVALIGAGALADHLGAFGYRGDDWGRFDRASGTVQDVIDPVTLKINFAGRIETVRLLGTVPPSDAGSAARSTEYLTARTQQRTVRLKLEALEPRDSFGRLL